MKTFKLNMSWKGNFEAMSNDTAGQVIKAIYAYAAGESLPDMSEAAMIAFSFISNELTDSLVKAKETSIKNSENGKKGGRPKKAPAKQDKPEPPKEDIPYAEIIGYLNEKTGKKYRWETPETKKNINGRWHDGYRLDDFKKVIDIKTAEWKGTKMEQFLRPATLFIPSKFEAYLNQKPVTDQKQTKNGFCNFEQRTDVDWSAIEDALDRQLV